MCFSSLRSPIPLTALLVDYATLFEAVRDLKGLIEFYVKVLAVDNF